MTALAQSERSTRRLPRILCVDDEPQVLAGIAANLRLRFEVVTAGGGAEAVRALVRSGPFDVIISDFQMPGMNGAEFLGRARTIAPDATRMLLTGHASLGGAVDAVNKGYIFRFLLKPCLPGDLIRALEEGVEQSRLMTADRILLQQKVEELSGHLLQTERLATLGTLAGGVGHELNNILTVFSTTHDFILERAREGLPPEDEDLANLRHVRDHVAAHARCLLDFGRPARDMTGQCDLGQVLEDAVSMLASAGALRSVDVRVTCPPGKPVLVKMDRTRTEQILVNLAKNAVDATEGRLDRSLTLEVVADEPGRVAICRAEDNGSGIPEEKLLAIFAPYYTTKPRHRGTGLGLFVVKQIVESAGGTISVESTVGKGSVFTVRLPLTG
jgi:signal transduction histidine kinase